MNEKALKKLKNGKFKTSVSQIDSADPREGGCYRAWWFKSVAGLPQPPRKASTFGDVVHEVCERFLLADDFGRDEEGNPVELFPEGWEESTNRWTGEKSGNPISEEEKADAKALVQAAIDQGMLTRQPGREIEKELVHSLTSHEGIDIALGGFIDLCEPDAIIDHKTTSSKRWMKSINKLKKNTQLVTYAFCRWESGEVSKDEPLWLRHNYFVKDKKTRAKHVEPREVQIRYADAKRYVNERVIPVVQQMVEILKTCETYGDVPLPEMGGYSPCQKYGGCAYQQVCSGQCSPEKYKQRINRMVENNNKDKYKEIAGELAGKKPKGENMDLEALKAKAKAAQASVNTSAPAAKPAQATKPEPTPTTEAVVVTEPKAVAGDDRPATPWCIDSPCKSCSTSPVKGIKDGKACPVCAMKGKAIKKIDAASYEINVIEGTTLVVSPIGDIVLEHVEEAEVSHKEKSESLVEAQQKEEEQKVKEALEAQQKAEAEAKEALEAQQKAEAEALKEEAEKEAVAKAKAKAQVKAEQPAEEKKEAPKAEPTGAAGHLEHKSERERGKLLIGCAIIETNGTGNGKLGTSSLVISGEQLVNAAKKFLMGTPEIAQECSTKGILRWEELNAFGRRDVIYMYGKQIAHELGSSTVQVRSIPRGTDLEHLVSAISPFMTVIQALVQ